MTLDLETISRIIRWREAVGLDLDLREGGDEGAKDDTGRSSSAVNDERRVGEGVGEVPVTKAETGKRVRRSRARKTSQRYLRKSNPDPDPHHYPKSLTYSYPAILILSKRAISINSQRAIRITVAVTVNPHPHTRTYKTGHIRPDILAAYRAQVEIYNRQVLFYGVGTPFVAGEIVGWGGNGDGDGDGDGGAAGGGAATATATATAIEATKVSSETWTSRVEDRGVSGSSDAMREDSEGGSVVGNVRHGALRDEDEDDVDSDSELGSNGTGTVTMQPLAGIGIGASTRLLPSRKLENVNLEQRGDVKPEPRERTRQAQHAHAGPSPSSQTPDCSPKKPTTTPGLGRIDLNDSELEDLEPRERTRQAQHAHASPISIASLSGYGPSSQIQTTLPNQSLNQSTTTPRPSRIDLNDSELEDLGFDPDLDINSEDIKLSSSSSSLSSESSSSSSDDYSDDDFDFDTDMDTSDDSDSILGLAKMSRLNRTDRTDRVSRSGTRKRGRDRDREYDVQKTSLLAHIETLKERARATIKLILEEREEMRVVVGRWRGLRRGRRGREEQRVRKGLGKKMGKAGVDVNVEGRGEEKGKEKEKERVVEMSATAGLEGSASGGLVTGVAAT